MTIPSVTTPSLPATVTQPSGTPSKESFATKRANGTATPEEYLNAVGNGLISAEEAAKDFYGNPAALNGLKQTPAGQQLFQLLEKNNISTKNINSMADLVELFKTITESADTYKELFMKALQQYIDGIIRSCEIKYQSAKAEYDSQILTADKNIKSAWGAIAGAIVSLVGTVLAMGALAPTKTETGKTNPVLGAKPKSENTNTKNTAANTQTTPANIKTQKDQALDKLNAKKGNKETEEVDDLSQTTQKTQGSQSTSSPEKDKKNLDTQPPSDNDPKNVLTQETLAKVNSFQAMVGAADKMIENDRRRSAEENEGKQSAEKARQAKEGEAESAKREAIAQELNTFAQQNQQNQKDALQKKGETQSAISKTTTTGSR